MPQWVRVDPRLALSYLALCLVACRPGPPPLPTGLQMVEPAQVAEWVARTTPTSRVLYRFTWLYREAKASKGGRGAVRLAPPDTIRLDFQGSLGIGHGSALLVADSAQWTAPERSIDELVPAVPLFWSMLGIARPPAEDDHLVGLADSGRTAWRYLSGRDTLDYVLRAGGLQAELRRGSRIVGRTKLTRAADGSPSKAILTVPSSRAQLEIKFYAIQQPDVFPPKTWNPPDEH